MNRRLLPAKLQRNILFSLCAALLLGLSPGSSLARAQAWLDPAWNHRIPFSVTPGEIASGGDFTDFTLLLTLDGANFASVFTSANPTGNDLVLTSGDALTVLEHELVTYDAGSQTAEIWFRTDLSEAQDSFYLYYGNTTESPLQAAVRTSAPGAAWPAEYLAVYHYAEDPALGVLADWGPGSNDAVADVAPIPIGPGWTSSNLVTGVAGNAWLYDGVETWTYSTEVDSPDSSFTISAWFDNSELLDKGAMAFQANNTVWDISFQSTGGASDSDLETPAGGATWFRDDSDGGMHHYLWTMDAVLDTLRFFFDGVEMEMTARWPQAPTPALLYSGESIDTRIGIASPYAYNSLDLADGVVDEYRIIEGVRNPDWILTEYRNQGNQSNFYAVGAEENFDGSPTAVDPGTLAGITGFGRVTISPNPVRGVAFINVETDASDVTVQVYDASGRLVRALARPSGADVGLLHFLWDGRDGAGTTVSDGVYYIRAHNGALSATAKALLVR